MAEALVEAPAEDLPAAEAPEAEAPAADLPAADLPAAEALAEDPLAADLPGDIPDLLLLEEEAILVLDGLRGHHLGHLGPLEVLEQEEL